MAISDYLKGFREPMWTTIEVDKFWRVLHPYLDQLLNGAMPLPDSDIDFTSLDPGNEKHKQHCIQIIHQSMWKGKYSLSVANIKAIKTFFQDSAVSANNNHVSVSDLLRELKKAFEYRPMTYSVDGTHKYVA